VDCSADDQSVTARSSAALVRIQSVSSRRGPQPKNHAKITRCAIRGELENGANAARFVAAKESAAARFGAATWMKMSASDPDRRRRRSVLTEGHIVRSAP